MVASRETPICTNGTSPQTGSCKRHGGVPWWRFKPLSCVLEDSGVTHWSVCKLRSGAESRVTKLKYTCSCVDKSGLSVVAKQGQHNCIRWDIVALQYVLQTVLLLVETYETVITNKLGICLTRRRLVYLWSCSNGGNVPAETICWIYCFRDFIFAVNSQCSFFVNIPFLCPL